MTRTPEKAETDVPSLVRGHLVACTGKLASMTKEEFQELVESYGGKLASSLGRGVRLLVVGQKGWPILKSGWLPEPLRKARAMSRREHFAPVVLTEDKFLAGLGLEQHRQLLAPLYSTGTLTELLGISRERVVAWVKAGLIKPAATEHGVWQFDFRQVSAAKTLCELARTGVSTARIRKTLEQLRAWMPEASLPLEQLSLVHNDGRLLVRLGEGDLAGLDGQLHFDFTEEPAPVTMRLAPGPGTAADWLAQGLEQEQEGYLAEAEASYREALALGGPDAQLCFNLANVLSAQGKKQSALERYRQAVEIEPGFSDAWNNLGTLLAEMEEPDEACAAFRKALEADAEDLRAHYNLADTLDDMGRHDEATPHWRAYLRFDQTSQWAKYARRRVNAG